MERTSTDSVYIHGSDADEQRRLSLLNSFMNDGSLRELDLRGGERILDVGCGLGQFTRAMARAVGPEAFVLGVERDDAQLDEARRQAAADHEESLVEFREGDAHDLPLGEVEWESFDLVHARWILEHVRDPLLVVRQMVRTVRPGGRIVLEDDDHDVLRLYPEPAGFWPVWQAYMRSYDRLGNDPFIGRRLVSLLSEAGARPHRNTWVFFGSCAGQENFAAIVENLTGLLRGARQIVLSQRLIEPEMFDEAVANLCKWGARPDAALWFSICWAEGIKPGTM